MNLISTNQALTMSSREIAAVTGSRHDAVKKSAERLAKESLITSPLAETPYTAENKQTYYEYHFAKRDCLVLVARLSPEFTAAVVDRWQELENTAAPKVPQTYAEALQLAADQAKQLELAKPKIAFVDNLVNRDTLMNATQVAQKHGLSAKALNKQLEDWKVYNKAVRRTRVFQHWFVTKGYGEMKKTESGHDQAMFTNAGEVWINEQLTELGE